MDIKFLFVSLSLCATSVSAQVVRTDEPTPALTRELLSVWQKHAILVDGATDPARIPYGYAIERAFLGMADQAKEDQGRFRQEISQLIPTTVADAERIREIALDSISVAGRVRDEASAKTDEVCEDLIGAKPGTANAVEFAERFSAIEAEEADQLTAHYRDAVSRLAVGTRTALEALVDRDIRGKMTWGHDLVGLANEVPDAFLAHRTLVCQRRLVLSPSDKAWKYTTETITVAPSE